MRRTKTAGAAKTRQAHFLFPIAIHNEMNAIAEFEGSSPGAVVTRLIHAEYLRMLKRKIAEQKLIDAANKRAPP